MKGDFEKVFSNAETFEDKNADYKYRSYIKRKDVASAINRELINNDYDNFKSSVSKDDNIRSNAYMNVCSTLHKIQS